MAKDQFHSLCARARIFKILFILPQTISLMKTTVVAARRGTESVSLVEFGNMKRFTPAKKDEIVFTDKSQIKILAAQVHMHKTSNIISVCVTNINDLAYRYM